MARCKACKAEIIWIHTPEGKWMPCDEGLHPYKQDPAGKDYVVTDRGEVIRCTLDPEGIPTGMARIPHWATCPEADRFKNHEQAAHQKS